MTRHPLRLTACSAAISVVAALGLAYAPPAPAADEELQPAPAEFICATATDASTHAPSSDATSPARQ